MGNKEKKKINFSEYIEISLRFFLRLRTEDVELHYAIVNG